MEHMLIVQERLGIRPALQVHDELVYIIPKKRLSECKTELLSIAKTPPQWASDCPIDAEVGYGPSYGDAK